MVLQGPSCAFIPALPEVEAEALDWGDRAGGVSCLHCLGVGSGGIGTLPPLPLVTCKVGIACVHRSYAPETVPGVGLGENLAAGRAGGSSEHFVNSWFSQTFRFCESVSVTARWWQGVSSGFLLWG